MSNAEIEMYPLHVQKVYECLNKRNEIGRLKSYRYFYMQHTQIFQALVQRLSRNSMLNLS